MKLLKKEFVSNVDHCGDHKFVQLKRTNSIAVYARYKMDGWIFGYEVFKIKTVKAGSPLPNNTVVAEDYESYPGKNAFGKTAMFFSAGNKKTDPENLYNIFVKRFGECNTKKEVAN
tara:strand:- start:1112 stop:1459 length:348 start_codon:yes stop_codon:yes gene_type:complete